MPLNINSIREGLVCKGICKKFHYPPFSFILPFPKLQFFFVENEYIITVLYLVAFFLETVNSLDVKGIVLVQQLLNLHFSKLNIWYFMYAK